jgi:hypothetical protein
MMFLNFWRMAEGDATSGGFDSRVEDYGDTEGMDTAIESYDPDDDAFQNEEGQQQSESSGGSEELSPNGATSKESSFSPYEFKGKVNGEEISQKFESKKDLDVAIARGIQAPKIYEALQAAKTDIAKLREDATWASDLQSLLKESPKDFFEHVVEELMPEEELMNFVHSKYHEYSRLAALSPEELARERKLKAADKLMQEQTLAEQRRQVAEKAETQARLQQERAQVMDWKNKERQYWEAKLPAHLKANLDEYMQAAMMTAQAHLNAGKQYTMKDMSTHLKKLLSPLASNTQNPTQSKREEARSNQSQAEANKKKLQDLARGQDAQPQRPRLKREDMWKKLKSEVVSNIK